MARSTLVLSIALLFISGCLAGPSATRPSEAAPKLPVTLLESGAQIEIPVPVTLIGFDATVMQALIEKAKVHSIRSNLNFNSYTFVLAAPPTRAAPQGPYEILANFSFHQPSDDFQEEFFQAASDARIGTGPTRIYDANLVEDWLAANLHRAAPAIDGRTPGIVLVHGGTHLPAPHAYRYTLPNGHLEPVRIFGEREPLLIIDVSAEADPYVVGPDPANPRGHAYDRPIADPSPADADVLLELVLHAAYFRLLQGPLYPPSLQACHGITLIQAIEVASPADYVPGVRSSASIVDRRGLHEAFSRILAPADVHLDVKTLLLPRDDPQLHAMLRYGQASVRWHVDQNWARYWVAHPGCESYVSLLWHPLSTAGSGGQALYSVQDGRRFSLSSASEAGRALSELQGTGTRKTWDLVNMLYAHETGHLLGLRHPHDLTGPDNPAGRFTFSSIWSAMSYQQLDRISQFGLVEQNNLHRNRAGLMLQAVQKADLDRGPTFDEGVRALGAYDWDRAASLFASLLPATPAPPWIPSSSALWWEETLPEEWTGHAEHS